MKHSDEILTLGSDHDLVSKNHELFESDKAMVFSERLLGRPEIREKIKALADKTMEQFKELGTPITVETMKTLLSLAAEGRLSIKEMGKRFQQGTVGVEFGNNGKFQFQVEDEEVAKNFQSQREDWTASGLYSDQSELEAPDQFQDADMVMIVAGYNTQRVNASPLAEQLINQDAVEIKDGRVQYGQNGLTSFKCEQIGFNTAGAVRMSSDTPISTKRLSSLSTYSITSMPSSNPSSRTNFVLELGSCPTPFAWWTGRPRKRSRWKTS